MQPMEGRSAKHPLYPATSDSLVQDHVLSRYTVTRIHVMRHLEAGEHFP